nr:hypothetical protein K-LCC10_0506 [Kaumoebavirus]
MDRELRTYLGRRLCGDVVKIIEEYVVGQARRVARLLNVIESITWTEMPPGMCIRCTRYRFGIVIKVYRFVKTLAISDVVLYGKESIPLMLYYSDWSEKCKDGSTYQDPEFKFTKIFVKEDTIQIGSTVY